MYDVIVVGYGPTGMLSAIQLGRKGHKVCVVERYANLYNLPRVGIVHDDVLRMFQEIGCLEAVKPATYFLPVYELANKGKVLLSNKVETLATHGWPEMTSIYQPAFEAELDKLAKAEPTIEVRQGAAAVGLAQDADKVSLTVEVAGGGRETIEGRYLIGADGGNSFIRRTLGIAYEDLGFDQNWLVIDARAKKPPRPELPLLRQFCEPEQPGMTMQMGPYHRRWSFMIFPGEAPEEAVKPENVWKRLNRPEGGTPEEFELVRVVAYKFQSLMAERWRLGRVFLAGDAAHQMPPFLAQGMCSGFRDAHNIAWKLDLVLSGQADERLLETYETEREPNARATIVESLRVGLNVNERDPEKVRKRDEAMIAMQKAIDAGAKPLIAFRVPGFAKGFVGEGKGAGAPFPQGRVTKKGEEGLFDDVAGRGFLIISKGDAKAALSKEDRAFWKKLGGEFVRLGARSVKDESGDYEKLMDDYGCDVLVKRPDYYTFAACAIGDLPKVIADLRKQLTN